MCPHVLPTVGARFAYSELEEEELRLGPDRVIALVAETIGGATLGRVTPVQGYFEGVRAVCDKCGMLLILDEVMCGMGRCGTRYACEQEGVVPDIISEAQLGETVDKLARSIDEAIAPD